MGFASAWLNERALFPRIISEAPDVKTGIIVVVPAYNEPGIVWLLDSLLKCSEPECRVEVIIVVNAPENAPEEYVGNNRLTISEIESWKKENINCFFRLFAFIADSTVKGWGVGLARKTGMDEALRRFDAINNPDGIILNLDADCQVARNYFVSVCNELLNRKERSACSIYFEHPITGIEYPESVYKSITQYELHLRYYFQGLAFSGFPSVFHTVGSAIAVKALPYIKAGGMNRKQAGEDFYFIQKLVPAGGYFSLNSTTVYPSPRPSYRVPFGTGASIEKLFKEDKSVLMTYNFLAFKDLKEYFSMTEKFFLCRTDEITICYNDLPESLRLFSDKNEWIEKIMEIRNNTSGLSSFNKRFFGWFNMFRIVKFLNFIHLDFFKKQPVTIAAGELLRESGMVFDSEDVVDLLLYYRKLEKEA
jgi:hypothetical protein